MRAHATFDTLQFSKRLTDAGLEPKISEELTEVIADLFQESYFVTQSHSDLTKAYFDNKIDTSISQLDNKIDISVNQLEKKIDRLEAKLDASINRLDNKIDFSVKRLDNKIDNLEAKMKTNMSQTETRLVKWMVGLFITNITIVSALIAVSQFLLHK